jgi:hypothetical protein
MPQTMLLGMIPLQANINRGLWQHTFWQIPHIAPITVIASIECIINALISGAKETESTGGSKQTKDVRPKK